MAIQSWEYHIVPRPCKWGVKIKKCEHPCQLGKENIQKSGFYATELSKQIVKSTVTLLCKIGRKTLKNTMFEPFKIGFDALYCS